MKVFPNPADREILFDLIRLSSGTKTKYIFDMAGNQLYTHKTSAGIFKWDIHINDNHLLASGVYLLSVVDAGYNKFTKIIIIRQ